jgi:hypothetical protein
MPKNSRSVVRYGVLAFVSLLTLALFQNCGGSPFKAKSQASLSVQIPVSSNAQSTDSCGRTPERKQKISRLMDSVISQLKLSAGFDPNYPQVVYNIQQITAAPLQAAINCSDGRMLDSLAELYSLPFSHLKANPSGDLMWLDQTNREIVLDSTQFIFAAAKLLNAIAHVEPGRRTPAMANFLNDPSGPRGHVIAHLDRWLHKRSMWTWEQCGFEQADPLLEYTFPDYVHRKLQRTLGFAAGAPVFCNALMEPEMWVATAALELLEADAFTHGAIGLTTTLTQELLAYAQLTTKLFEDRVSFQTACDDGRCVGALVDVGFWLDHPGFPGGVWDFSHSSRYAQWIDTIYSKKQFSAGKFDQIGITQAFANQLIYKIFNGDFKQPAFANYWNGSNVTFSQPNVSWGPWELSFSYYRAGYGFWGRYQGDVDRLNRSLLTLVETQGSSPNMVSAGNLPSGDYDLLGFYCSLAYAP